MDFSSSWGGGGVCLGQSHFKGEEGCVACWVVGGLGHARHHMPFKISSSCLLDILPCWCVGGVKVRRGLECSFSGHCWFWNHFRDI